MQQSEIPKAFNENFLKPSHMYFKNLKKQMINDQFFCTRKWPKYKVRAYD